MKFIYADSLDFVDPGYDFLADRNAPGRSPYWDDVYPHEILGYAPYDGILVSRGIVGGDKVAGKYSEAQAMRFRRVGARAFLRLDEPTFREDADLRRLRRLHLPPGRGAALHARGHGRVLRRRRLHPRLLGRPHHLRLRREP